MKTVTVEREGLRIQDLIKLAASGPVILTEKGSPTLAVVPIDESDAEAWQLGEDPDFLELIERSRARYRTEGGIPLDEVRRRLKQVAES